MQKAVYQHIQQAYIDIHTHQASSGRDVFALINLTEGLAGHTKFCRHGFFSAGIHPWHTESIHYLTQLDQLTQLIVNTPTIIAIGETGIDKYCDTDLPLQQLMLESHLKLASSYNLPVIIHCTKAYEEVLRLLSAYPEVKAVFHGFHKHPQLARRITKAGYYLSFGSFLDQEDHQVHASLRATPPEALLLETDDGRHTISTIYDLAAQSLGISLSTLQGQIQKNALAFLL